MPPDPAPGRGEIVLFLATTDELFDGPAPGRRAFAAGTVDWDAVGAGLGEPGATRLLRLLHAHPDARSLRVRLATPGPAEPSDLEARLRAWASCRVLANDSEARVARSAGARALGACLGLLALALGASWALQHEPLLGPPGPIRTLVAEALVIAGWVAMWRPLEMFLFDPVRPRRENRLLRRLLAMPWRIEPAA